MVFSSIVFLLYFLPAFLLIYFLVPKGLKNLIILVGSIFFYAWGAPKFIFVILLTTFVDYHLVRVMDATTNYKKRKLILLVSVLMNLGLLVYFKYSNFFIENLNSLFNVFGVQPIGWAKLILPIGISFYTFETITYVVDVYRRVHKPLKNFWDYQVYIILFPKLIAGPIVRYHEIADQITSRDENNEKRLTGFYRFVIGLAKKVFIANQMGAVADEIFASDLSTITAGTAWLGSFAYTFQIYFDFSGYSDMAIGLGKMMGFKFPENFDNPYISQSITEFWRRWHITLGKWMRNYLYIPLGGNRVPETRLYFNLWIVFLVSGFWHGANWNFILWGALHGFFLVLERLFLGKFLVWIGKVPAIIFTFLIINLTWVVFKLEHIEDACIYFQRMFAADFHLQVDVNPEFKFYLFLAVIFSFFAATRFTKNIQDKIYFHSYSNIQHVATWCTCIILFVLSIGVITSTNFNPFIYFRF